MQYKLLMLLLLIFYLTSVISAQTLKFTEVNGIEFNHPSVITKWNFSIKGSDYEILSNGRSKRVSDKLAAQNFRLTLGKGEMIENFYFAYYKNSLIFVYGANRGGEGLGYITSINPPTLKPKWSAIIGGFNVGQGLIENKFAYLTATGFIGKINLLTGKYVWKHDDLYRKFDKHGAFNLFELPQLDGNNITFTERAVYNKTNILVVNKTTGKIVRTVLGK